MLLPGSTIYFGTWNGTLLVNTPVGVVTARSVTTPVFCPTIFSPLKLMEALFRISSWGAHP